MALVFVCNRHSTAKTEQAQRPTCNAAAARDRQGVGMAPLPATTHCSFYGLSDFNVAHQNMLMLLKASERGANTMACLAPPRRAQQDAGLCKIGHAAAVRDGAVLVL